MTQTRSEWVAAVEAMLFSSPHPLSIAKLTEALDEVERDEVKQAVDALRERIQETPDSGIELLEVAGGYQLCTKPDYADIVQRLYDKAKGGALSPAALETLAIIAYRQPLTRAEMSAIRGVDVSGPVKVLMDRKLIKIHGRKEVPGRPFLYVTTKGFLDLFGLSSIKDLPSFDEFQKLVAEQGALEELAEAEAEALREGHSLSTDDDGSDHANHSDEFTARTDATDSHSQVEVVAQSEDDDKE